MKKKHLYLMVRMSDKAVKIGVSDDPIKRAKSLKAAHGKMWLQYSYTGISHSEKEIHCMLAQYFNCHVKGEFFQLDDNELALLTGLLAVFATESFFYQPCPDDQYDVYQRVKYVCGPMVGVSEFTKQRMQENELL